MATKQYEFQPPMNMEAIRSSIMRRIQNKRKEEQQQLQQQLTLSTEKMIAPSSLPPLSTSSTSSSSSSTSTLPRHLDNGLPSPPVDSFDGKPVDSEMVVNALLELSHSNQQQQQQQMEPPSPVLSQSKSTPSSPGAMDSDAIRQKIKELEQEKHRLFQVMKDLLSQPKDQQSKELSLLEEQEQEVEDEERQAKNELLLRQHEVIEEDEEQVKPEKERARSQSREKINNRPAIRSRSISHSEYRPAARYGGNYHRSPSRFYNYDNRYAYPSSSRSYPLVSPMTRRVPSYVSSRPQPPARPSSFRRPDRHLPRY